VFSFTIREIRDELLIPLPLVIERLPCQDATNWRFLDISVNAGTPFGIPAVEFEQRSRVHPGGYCVSKDDFNAFLRTGIQIIDGSLCALSGIDASLPLFCLDCIDASQWEVTTEHRAIADEIEKRGWARQ
jgi:hypothetical protein